MTTAIKPQNKREDAERRKKKKTQSQSIQDSPQLGSERSWASRGTRVFDREKPSKIKNPSINGRKDDVIPGAEAELFILQNGVNMTFRRLALMIRD